VQVTFLSSGPGHGSNHFMAISQMAMREQTTPTHKSIIGSGYAASITRATIARATTTNPAMVSHPRIFTTPRSVRMPCEKQLGHPRQHKSPRGRRAAHSHA
jgi:hypothetical protein